MSVAGKAALVATGYAGAVAIAWIATSVYISFESPQDRGSHGMLAFSESLVFLFAFCGAALVPTAGALYWLRGLGQLWTATSRLALVVAVTSTGAAALVAFNLPGGPLAVLRLLITPLLAAGFVLCAALAPDRSSRSLLSLAAALEGASAVYAFIHWFLPIYFA